MSKRINTPALAEAIADCLLLVSSGITGYALYDNNIFLGTVSLITGLLGRVVARLFRDENKDGIADIFNINSRSDSRSNSK